MKARVLFLCTGNCVRSQMAAGLANALHAGVMEAVSAGSRPAGFVHPDAIEAMKEIGIDISGAQSKSADAFRDQPFDVVVTVCDSAALDCPSWPGAKRIEHWPIDDPSSRIGEPAELFRATRDELSGKIDALAATLE